MVAAIPLLRYSVLITVTGNSINCLESVEVRAQAPTASSGTSAPRLIW